MPQALTTLLEEALSAWGERRLGVSPHAVLDARYESVRHGSQGIDAAMLPTPGIRRDGKRELPGVSVALSEADVHWLSMAPRQIGRGQSEATDGRFVCHGADASCGGAADGMAARQAARRLRSSLLRGGIRRCRYNAAPFAE